MDRFERCVIRDDKLLVYGHDTLSRCVIKLINFEDYTWNEIRVFVNSAIDMINELSEKSMMFGDYAEKNFFVVDMREVVKDKKWRLMEG